MTDRAKILINVWKFLGGIYFFPKLLYYNYFCGRIRSKSHLPILLNGYSVLDLHPTSQLLIGENLQCGVSHVKNSRIETRIKLDENAKMIIPSHYIIYAGSFISVCANSELVLHAGFINENTQIICGDRIEIGEGTAIGRNVVIRSDDGHSINGMKASSPISIGKHVWIGQHAIILKGVTIGDGAVIGAGAIVTKDIPSNCLAVGVPAKVIKTGVVWS